MTASDSSTLRPAEPPPRRRGPLPAVRGAVRRARAGVAAVAPAVGGWLLLAVASAPPALAAVCPQAPPGTQQFADDITSWVKWGVLALIGIGAVGSIGAVAFGRFMHNTQVSRFGTTGTLAAVCCAIAYGVILVIVDSIVGTGCT